MRGSGRVTTFAQKLLAALLASVGVVLLLALFVVRRETGHQIDAVSERMTGQSREAFRELEELKRRDLERLGSAFTDSRRTVAAVEAAAAEPSAAAQELEWLIQTVRYELELKRMPHSLVAFTDARGEPIVTLRDGVVAPGEDPAQLRAPALRLVETGAAGVDAHRAVGGELFAVQIRRLALGGALIGTVALGVPVDDAEATRLGDVLGVEICFVLSDECLAGTPFARAHLAELTAGERAGALVRAGDRRWRVIADELTPERPGEATRVLAVPMDETLAPFARIRRALLIAGVASLALALVLGLVLSRQLSGPVRDLVAATARVAAGSYSVRVPVRTNDELGQLGNAFNTMTEGLEQKERYRGLLDKVVSSEVAEELLRTDIALGGETREVTTLFVDISSFTPMTEGMEPQRVVALVNRIMSRLGEVVETHGGVVDKYLGDGLMALFGAPVARADHAVRAVRAALRMQEEMAALERERATGDAPVRVAIGIHTGPVVAGNIGSATRLNYTVVGEGVNLAARLCQGAGPGVILVSEAVHARTGDVFAMDAAGARPFKGFSRPLDVFEVTGERPPARPGSARGALSLLGTVLACVMATPSGASAQGGLPTLSDLGVRYMSPGGGLQVDMSGRLDIEGYFPQARPQWLVRATDPLLAGRLRLFADVFAGDALYALVEVRADRGEAPDDAPVEARLEQLFARLALPAGLQLQAGKFASPVGGYPSRHHGPEDPLIRPPVMYDYQTIIDPAAAPAALAGFLGWKDDPVRRPAGVPVIWNVPYPWGALLAGVAGRLDFRAGVLSAAPSSRPEMWRLDDEQLGRPSVVAAAGFRFIPELRVNAWYSRGSYMDELKQGALPAGTSLDDFVQELLGAEIVFARGHASMRAEMFANRWHVPNIPEDPRDISYSVEGRVKLAAGLFTAARYGAIRYNTLGGGGGVSGAWDHDIQRFQLGAGYRVLRNTEVRAEYLISRTSGVDPRDDLLSLQWWWAF